MLININRGGGKIILVLSIFLNLFFVSKYFRDKELYRPSRGQAILGWTNSIKKLNQKFDVAFFGNSITRNSDFTRYFKDCKIINLGCGGDRLQDMLLRMDMLKAAKADKIFVMAGINGSKDISLQEFSSLYSQLIDSIKYNNNTSEIFIQSILPISKCMENKESYASNDKIRKMNDIISNLCKQKNIVYIDLFDAYFKNGELPFKMTKHDGIHISDENYNIWASLISPYIISRKN